ncbi:uncharacterized protein LOC128138638 [Harpia harpyja]|uniref:uncharacterized protein LOC128138638 n=1 Tax=Harpia harpyja TaxID=202280 RepID=UPI0022B15F6B|nr:uncharacterized protein LOC128138638 [Harpia harpyja]
MGSCSVFLCSWREQEEEKGAASLWGGQHAAPAHPGAAGCPAPGRAIDRGHIPEGCQRDGASGAEGGPGRQCGRRPGKPACAPAGRHLEGLPPKHPWQTACDQPLCRVDDSSGKDNQAGEGGRVGSGGRQVACSKPPPPQAAAVPAPAYRPQCVHQQDELQQYGHRVGPNLLSPANEDLLPLELLLEVPDKVNMLEEFLIENCRKIFGEEMAGLSSPPVEELPAPMDRSTELPLEEQCGPAGEADVEHQAKAFLDAPPSLLILQKAAGAHTVMGSETAEYGSSTNAGTTCLM